MNRAERRAMESNKNKNASVNDRENDISNVFMNTIVRPFLDRARRVLERDDETITEPLTNVKYSIHRIYEKLLRNVTPNDGVNFILVKVPALDELLEIDSQRIANMDELIFDPILISNDKKLLDGNCRMTKMANDNIERIWAFVLPFSIDDCVVIDEITNVLTNKTFEWKSVGD